MMDGEAVVCILLAGQDFWLDDHNEANFFAQERRNLDPISGPEIGPVFGPPLFWLKAGGAAFGSENGTRNGPQKFTNLHTD